MSKKVGYIKLSRAILDNHLWLEEPFSRSQAWIDLLLLAAFKECTIRIRGNQITVNRGQLARSETFLAERWQWSRGKVRRFLNELETRQQIVQQKNSVTSLITIRNYNEYQSGGTASSTSDGTTDGTTDGTAQEEDINIYPTGDGDKSPLNDSVKDLFDTGVKILTQAGQSEKSARAIVGKCRKMLGDENALRVILKSRYSTDPSAYINAACIPTHMRGRSKNGCAV